MSAIATIQLEAKLSEQLARAAREAADLTEPMAEASEVMLAATRERFAREESPAGVPWKKSRRAIEEGAKTLQLKGFLIRSLDRRSGPDFAEAGVVPGAPQSAYARIHQEGGIITPKRKKALSFGGRLVAKVVMPARAYLGFSADETARIGQIFTRHLRGAFGGGAEA